MNKGRGRPFPVLVSVALTLMVVTTQYRNVNPTACVGRERLANLPVRKNVSTRLEPADYKHAITAPVEVTDREQIAALVAAMSPLAEYQPNHPHTTREVIVRIRFADREIGGALHLTSNDGTIFFFMSDIEQGWVYGTYEVPRGAAPFDLIASLVAPAKR